MRVFFVAKRHPQQRDLIERPYGRFFQLPRLLAMQGHDVAVALIGHRGQPAVRIERGAVTWETHDVRDPGPLVAWRSVLMQARSFAPDWVIGCSHAWVGCWAHRLARKLGTRLCLDAYDNFEAYMPWNLPLTAWWRHALRDAEQVTAAGPQLASRFDEQRRDDALRSVVVPMAADPAFVPHNRSAARAALHLPANAPLMGYSGGWASNRGTHVLLDVFRRVRARNPDARLVLTGRPPAEVVAEPGVQSLGYLTDAQLPVALSALDVACVVTANTSFGRYSYPAKLCEAMACGVPVVATATEPVRWMLRDDARFLVPVGDAVAIAERVLTRFQEPRMCYAELPTWEDSARLFEAALRAS